MMEQVLSTKTNLRVIREQHTAAIERGLEAIHQETFERAAYIIRLAVDTRHTIYTIGNGASASIAQHWACDYTKGCTDLSKDRKVRVVSLSANIPLMTAISNDVSYDEVYSYQMERVCDQRDVVIAISSSGNSPNIVRAIETAIKQNMYVIALTGFEGGRAKQLADQYARGVCVHVPLPEYEATEDCHQAIMHMIAKYLRQ